MRHIQKISGNYLLFSICITIGFIACKKDIQPDTIVTPPDPTVTAPQVTTQAASNIYSISAILSGTVTDSGSAAVTERGICLDSLLAPTVLKIKLQAGSGLGSFATNATNLLPHKLYYARAYAINTGGVSYGNEISFTTADTFSIPPGPSITLKKIILTIPGFGSDSSMFLYDSNNRLISEDYRGQVLGMPEQKVITNVNRNAAGIITGYVRTYTNYLTGQFTNQEVAVVQHDPANGHYVSKKSTFTFVGTIAWPRYADSVLYTYNGNNPVQEFRYSKFTLTGPFDTAYKTDFMYAGNNPEIRHVQAFWYDDFNDWNWDGDLEYSQFDLKTNPLYVPDYALVAGLLIQEAEDDNLNWNWQCMTPYNVKQTITGFSYANPTYTYWNDLPLTRTYNDFGLVNTVQFIY